MSITVDPHILPQKPERLTLNPKSMVLREAGSQVVEAFEAQRLFLAAERAESYNFPFPFWTLLAKIRGYKRRLKNLSRNPSRLGCRVEGLRIF